MPEGHTLHRLAERHRDLLAGRLLRADSPQGRFALGAARLDGHELADVQAWGKHLFYDVPAAGVLHVHLGLYGKFADGPQPAPPVRGAVRVRLQTESHWVELRGAPTVELLARGGRELIMARLGPDPLRPDADPAAFTTRAVASRMPVAVLLADQRMLAGVGNVYRAELLFRAGIDPYRPGRDLPPQAWRALWDDTVTLLRAGMRTGRIVTTRPADRSRARGPVGPHDAHYVYRRTGLPCRVCGAPVRRAPLAGRNLYWCPACQR